MLYCTIAIYFCYNLFKLNQTLILTGCCEAALGDFYTVAMGCFLVCGLKHYFEEGVSQKNKHDSVNID